VDIASVMAERRQTFVAAFNREDLTALACMCADDIALMPPNQPLVASIAAAIEWCRTGFTGGRTHLRLTAREQYVGDGWVFEWVDWAMNIVPLTGGPGDTDSGSAFWLWRPEGNGVWKLARAMWNSSSDTPSLWAGGLGDFPADDFFKLMAPIW
jgi:ketosteroid isomerase-like protein